MYKKIVIILIIFLLISLIGCKPKKIYVDRVVTDTVRVNSQLVITLPSVQQFSIKNPCDSLGNLKPIIFFQDNGKNRIQFSTKNNQLIIKSSVKPDTSSVKDTFKSHQSNEKQIIEKTITPKWAYQLLIYSIIVTALLLWRLGVFKLIL